MSHPEKSERGRRAAVPSSGEAGSAPPTRETATRGPGRPAPYIAAGILLAAAIIFPLLPQTYSFDEPRLASMPFFYWYQLLWVPISAILTSISYWLVSREDRRRRAAASAGGPPENGPAAAGATRGGGLS